MRIGQGWDLHRLVPGRKLIIGGIYVPWETGAEAHSDGDVLIHAIIDALFGAAALGDIGKHFPPEDDEFKDISSGILLERTGKILKDNQYRIINIDTTLVLEKPKISDYTDAMRGKIAANLSIPADRVSIKAKTKEGVDASGRGEAVEAFAVVLIERF